MFTPVSGLTHIEKGILNECMHAKYIYIYMMHFFYYKCCITCAPKLLPSLFKRPNSNEQYLGQPHSKLSISLSRQ